MEFRDLIPYNDIIYAANIPPEELAEQYDILAEKHDAILNLFQISTSQNLSLQQALIKSGETDKKLFETMQNANEIESKKFDFLEAKIAMLENQLSEKAISAEAVNQSSKEQIKLLSEENQIFKKKQIVIDEYLKDFEKNCNFRIAINITCLKEGEISPTTEKFWNMADRNTLIQLLEMEAKLQEIEITNKKNHPV